MTSSTREAKRMLIVDDSAAVRRILGAMLRIDGGFDVDTAADGIVAQETVNGTSTQQSGRASQKPPGCFLTGDSAQRGVEHASQVSVTGFSSLSDAQRMRAELQGHFKRLCIYEMKINQLKGNQVEESQG